MVDTKGDIFVTLIGRPHACLLAEFVVELILEDKFCIMESLVEHGFKLGHLTYLLIVALVLFLIFGLDIRNFFLLHLILDWTLLLTNFVLEFVFLSFWFYLLSIWVGPHMDLVESTCIWTLVVLL